MTNLTTQRNRPESRGGEETLRIQELGERLVKEQASTDSHEGVESQPSEAGVKALAGVANKYGITPEAMNDIISATLQAFNVRTAQPGPSHEMPSLDEASFSRAGRTATSRNSTESEGMPQTWRRSRLESGASYADGRAQLRSWLKDINAVRGGDKNAKLLMSDRFKPDELKFNPADNTITVVGTYQPLFHWRRFVAAYKAFFGN
jgi:hypothetical protein